MYIYRQKLRNELNLRICLFSYFLRRIGWSQKENGKITVHTSISNNNNYYFFKYICVKIKNIKKFTND